MSETVINKPKKKKVLKRVIIIILALILVVIAAFAILFRGEIATIMTVKEEGDTHLYNMEYKGDYGLDAFLKEGASSDAELIGFISKRLLKGIPLKFDLPDLSCSTFLAQTPEGDYIFGRNFDNKETPVLMLTTKPKDGYASISAVNLSFLGYTHDYLPDKMKDRLLILAAPYAPLDGINEKGLSIGVLQLDSIPTRQDTGKVPINTTAAIRLILDKAATVDEALDLLQQYDMCSSAGAAYHYQITDATGRSVVVEYVKDVFTVLDCKMATNFYLAPGKMYHEGDGKERYAIVKKGLAKSKGIKTEEEAMDLLDAAKQYDTPWPTQWSIVYNNTNKTALLCVYAQYETKYTYKIEP